MGAGGRREGSCEGHAALGTQGSFCEEAFQFVLCLQKCHKSPHQGRALYAGNTALSVLHWLSVTQPFSSVSTSRTQAELGPVEFIGAKKQQQSLGRASFSKRQLLAWSQVHCSGVA